MTGLSWFDHEWGTGSIGKDTAGWDWFGLHLLDGRDLMLYRMRAKSGSATSFSSGTLVAKDGKLDHFLAEDFSIEETARWKSPSSGGTYPSRWTLHVPRASLHVEVVPVLAGQELVTEKSTRVTYWEGACDVTVPGSSLAARPRVRRDDGLRGNGRVGRAPLRRR